MGGGEQHEPTGWSGRVLLEPGLLAFDGEIGDAHRHTHAAVQVVVVREGSVTATDADGGVATGTRFVIPAGISHSLTAGAARGSMLYLDHTGDVGRTVSGHVDPTARHRAKAWARGARTVPWLQSPDPVEHVRGLLARVPGRAQDGHPVVLAAMDVITSSLHGPVRIGQVAAAVGVSADHLGRLFRRQVGLTFPAFVRWRRLMVAAAEVRAGATLTDAAHAAGFADSSHVNRVAHEMFGVGPSEMALLVRPA